MQYLLVRLVSYLKDRNLLEKSYVVGGAVRDILFRRDIKDIDIAIDCDIDYLVREFTGAVKGSLICLDKEMSIFRIVKNKQWIDISRLRYGALYLDLFERDLTINAMAIPLSRLKEHEKSLIDPFGGYEDFLKGVIRMVREENFLKDPLRVLRVFRFSATLGFSIEANTLDAAGRYAHYLKDIARERIFEEIQIIVRCQTSAEVVRLMKERRILTHVFALAFVDSAIKRYCEMELLLNTLESKFSKHIDFLKGYVNNGINLFCLKFFTLFEDKRDVLQSGLSLRISNKETEKLQTYTDYQGRLYDGFRKSEGVYSEYIVRLLYDLGDDIYGICLLDMVNYTHEDEAFFDFIGHLISFYKTDYESRRKKIPLFTGKDIIELLNIKPSAIYKDIINYVNIMTLLGRISTKREAFDLIYQKYGAGLSSQSSR